MTKIFTVDEVGARCTRIRDPATGFVANDQTTNALQAGLACRKNALDARKHFGTGSFGLETDDESEDARIHQVDAVFGVLHHRARQIGGFDFRGFQHGFVRRPFPPAVHGQNGGTNQHDEGGRPERQRRQANFVRNGVHLRGILRMTENPTYLLSIPEVDRAKAIDV
jgi:hypothetical protein